MNAAWAALLWLAPGWQQPPPLPEDSAAALAAAVDLGTPAARKLAAETLARRSVTLEQWLALCTSFGTFAAEETGPQRHLVDLQVGENLEHTEVFLYVPQKYDPARPAPLLLACHGSGGTGAQCYLPFQPAADQLGMLVLAVTDPNSAEGYRYSPRERQQELAALRWARRKVNVDEDRVFVSGVSRGGHLTWDLILRFPDRWAAAAPVSAGPRLGNTPGENNLRYVDDIVQLPIRAVQGENDDAKMIDNLHICFDRLKKMNAADAQLLLQKNRGHYDPDLGAVDWQEFFGKAHRDPVPHKLVCMAANKEQARAFWVEITAFDQGVAEQFAPQVPGNWGTLDELAQHRLWNEIIIQHTARLQIAMTAPGRFRAEGKGCKRFQLLLARDMLASDGSVEVVFAGKTSKLKPKPDAAVLLREFVERFDRHFLPVVAVDVP